MKAEEAVVCRVTEFNKSKLEVIEEEYNKA
ncbi:MAG: hypothetical protein BTN85_0125 [Candidatus Methanohalarchaeum thermophilum]|uniref:Uncharacterized protein n=1 Tax=Methanohalarchaeum thermophilum TaxID=1903181 RepID=A0A1Q6DTI6_METT1|nr:MAG: hypothetical protein BTN85_0125 [Candidatus Methanohalarchaeum thermophilum]